MRINHVQSARKSPGKCGKCGTPIRRGDPYRWAKSRYGPKIIRCKSPSCNFRASDLSSSKTALIEDAIEDAREAIDAAEDYDSIKSALEDCASVAREVAEEYQQANDSWAGGQGRDDWQEKADACESFADELESWEYSGETDEEAVRQGVRDEEDGPEQGEDEDAYAVRLEELEDVEWERVLQEMRDEARDVLDGFDAG